MGTLVDKIKYLLETKKLIKEAILDMGVLVYNTDTFKDYVDKIKSIRVNRDNIYICYLTSSGAQAILENGKVFDVSDLRFEWNSDAGTDKGYLVYPDGTVKEITRRSTAQTPRGDYKIIVGNCVRSFKTWWDIREDFVIGNGNKVKFKQLDRITNVEIYDLFTMEEITFEEFFGQVLPSTGEIEVITKKIGIFCINVYTDKSTYEITLELE